MNSQYNPDLLQSATRERRYTRWRVQIFLVTGLAYAGFYLTRKSFAIAKVGIVDDETILISTTQMGVVDFFYLCAYAVGQFVFGMCADRLGARKIVLIGMFASVLTAIAMGASSIVALLGLFSCIQGLCQSTGWAPLTKNFSAFFARHERGRMMGLWCFSYSIGAFLASWYAGWAGETFGWRAAFFIPAGTLLIVMVLFYILQVNEPEDVDLPPIEPVESTDLAGETIQKIGDLRATKSWQSIFKTITTPMVLLLGILYFMQKPTRYAIMFWGPLYVSQKLGYQMKDSAFISSLFFLSGPLGAYIGGWISDKCFSAKRMPVCAICLLLLAVLLSFLEYVPASPWWMGSALFLAGFLLYPPDIMISGIAAVDFGSRKGAGTAAGIINGFGSTGAILGGSIPGYVSENYGWIGVFVALACTTFIAGIISCFFWNAQPKSQEIDMAP